ncbi:MAG: YkgJ family cysteine cluster protein [Treponema sp.]|jgi:Fe-S-cluster containining protein|nr:YkgJ family cysteine cluster protein [Treponema sp.]
MKDESFYASGLNFSCQRCSSCCRHDAGYVYLSENDIEKLIAKLETDRDSFIGLYCRLVKNWNGNKTLSLKEKSNKDCIFWESKKGCIVYGARPLQCKLFPFWESILFSKDSWKMASESCPGMNLGKHYSKEEINTLLEMRQGEI